MQHGPGMHGGLVGTMIIAGVIVAALGYLVWKIVLARRLDRTDTTRPDERKREDSSDDERQQ